MPSGPEGRRNHMVNVAFPLSQPGVEQCAAPPPECQGGGDCSSIPWVLKQVSNQFCHHGDGLGPKLLVMLKMDGVAPSTRHPQKLLEELRHLWQAAKFSASAHKVSKKMAQSRNAETHRNHSPTPSGIHPKTDGKGFDKDSAVQNARPRV